MRFDGRHPALTPRLTKPSRAAAFVTPTAVAIAAFPAARQQMPGAFGIHWILVLDAYALFGWWDCRSVRRGVRRRDHIDGYDGGRRQRGDDLVRHNLVHASRVATEWVRHFATGRRIYFQKFRSGDGSLALQFQHHVGQALPQRLDCYIRGGKPKTRRGKILLINAVNEVTRERAQSFLTDDHIERIVQAYEKFADTPGFARVVTLAEVRAKDGKLSIPLYVAPATNAGADADSAPVAAADLAASLSHWLNSSTTVRQSLETLGITIKTK